METLAIHTTKPFMSGRSQAIRIPKEYQLEDTEVVITPKDSLKNAFYMGLSMLSDDFLADGRPTETSNKRVEL